MKLDFVTSNSLKFDLDDWQAKQISSPENIRKSCMKENVIAYDIFANDNLVGFAMLKNSSPGKWFLWNYAIDKQFQGKGLGEKALRELISLMQDEFNLIEMVTTYIWGNDVARNLYTKVGFQELDIIDEPDCHEVNMMLNLKSLD